jgi:hypothetical protein
MPSTWAGTASNGLVTFDALRDAVNTGVFESKVVYSSIPSGNKIVTKNDVETYLWIDASASPWSGYTSNRCPPKSSFVAGNVCILISISYSDILSSTGNTSYPDGTVYVTYSISGYDYTQSFTSAGNYQQCGLPATSVPSNQTIYYYAYDSINYFTSSSIGFYPYDKANCNTVGCVGTAYTVGYSSSNCATACSSGTPTTIYVTTTPTWAVGTRIASNSNGTGDVATGYYSYAGKCYYVNTVCQTFYPYGDGGKAVTYCSSQVVSVSNC